MLTISRTRSSRFLTRLLGLSMAASLPLALLTTSGCGGSDEPAAIAGVEEAATDEAKTERAEAIAKAVAEGKTVVTPEQLVVAADQLIKKGRNVDANKLLSVAIKVKPDLAEAYVLRASILAANSLPTKAIANMSKAIQLKPGTAGYHTVRGRYLLARQEYAAALADFDTAIGIDGSLAAAHNHRGLVNIAISQHEAALADFNNAIAADPKFVEAYTNRGYVKFRLDQQTAAIADYDQAIALNPNYVNAYDNRGVALLNMNRPADAAADFSKAISLAPGKVALYDHRARAYEKAGDAAKARADRDEVVWLRQLAAHTQNIRRNPDAISPYLSRSSHLLGHGLAQDALADLDRALQRDPKSVDAMIAKARLLADTDQTDAAIALCDEALAIEANPDAYSVRGDIRYAAGTFDLAIADYQAAQRLDSQVARAYFERSRQLKQAGNIQQASAAYETAVQMDPSLATR